MADHFWVPGNSAGPHIEKPGKLLLHTTEGSSIEGAVAAYRANNSWPHSTVDFRFGHPYRICRHLGYDVAARALRNLAGGVQTNTAGVIQLEVVGFATRPHEIDWAAIGREVIGPTCNALAIPITSTVTWVAYPASYGQQAPQRLSGPAWLGYRGILGHQHAPENSHGDPGAIPIQALLAAANPTPPLPEEDDDMPYLIRNEQSGAIYLMDPTTGPVHLINQATAEDYSAKLKTVNIRIGSDADWLVRRGVDVIVGPAEDLEAIRLDLADEEPASPPG